MSSNDGATSVTKQTSLDDILSEINKIQHQNNTIATQTNEIKKEITNIKVDFQKIREDVNKCKEDMKSISKSHEFLASQFDTHKKQQDSVIKSHAELINHQNYLVERINTLEKKLSEEIVNRSHGENNSRKMNVELSGIPITHNEDCKEIIAKIGREMGLNITRNNIDVAHRLFKKDNNHIPIIIARFYSRTERDAYFFKRSSLKDKTIKDFGFEPTTESAKMKNKIYINESLSIYTKQIFKYCRMKCQEK